MRPQLYQQGLDQVRHLDQRRKSESASGAFNRMRGAKNIMHRLGVWRIRSKPHPTGFQDIQALQTFLEKHIKDRLRSTLIAGPIEHACVQCS
jgi:hypothetical protein